MRFALLASVLYPLVLTSCTAAPDPNPTATELAVGSSPELGRYLTDLSGRAVYALPAELAEGCDDACAAQWPPVPGGKIPGEPKEPAIQQELIGVLERSSGPQLSYGGQALHYRGRTEATDPPERSVKDEWGTWSLLFPHGERMVP